MKCVMCGKEMTSGIVLNSGSVMCDECAKLHQVSLPITPIAKKIYKLYTLEDLVKYIKKFPQYEIEVVADAEYDFGIEVNNEDKQLIIYTKPSRDEIKN